MHPLRTRTRRLQEHPSAPWTPISTGSKSRFPPTVLRPRYCSRSERGSGTLPKLRRQRRHWGALHLRHAWPNGRSAWGASKCQRCRQRRRRHRTSRPQATQVGDTWRICSQRLKRRPPLRACRPLKRSTPSWRTFWPSWSLWPRKNPRALLSRSVLPRQNPRARRSLSPS